MKILLPKKITFVKTSECYMLSVNTFSTPSFVKWPSISVKVGKNKIKIYENPNFLICIHNYTISFVNKLNMLSYLKIIPPCALWSSLEGGIIWVWVWVWVFWCWVIWSWLVVRVWVFWGSGLSLEDGEWWEVGELVSAILNWFLTLCSVQRAWRWQETDAINHRFK